VRVEPLITDQKRKTMSSPALLSKTRDKYGTPAEETPYELHQQQERDNENDGLMRSYVEDDDDDDDNDSADSEEEPSMTIEELLYSSSSYYAIAKPVTLTMMLASLAVVFVNTDETRAQGQQAMESAYQVWSVEGAASSGSALALSLANALVMVSVICCMTFVIVLLYRMRCMLCLIGYMMFCSGTLLGVLGGNLMQTAIHIYNIPVDKITFSLFVSNFCIVGVLSVFWGKGVPKYVTQGYLISTSVILAWHLSYFDDWTTWTLLFMLAIYDLCAVLTPCGPLKALVELMSADEAPEMPGLLFEAELPPEAKRPGIQRTNTGLSRSSQPSQNRVAENSTSPSPTGNAATGDNVPAGDQAIAENPTALKGRNLEISVPLAIAQVYNLSVISVPANSMKIMYPQRDTSSSAPLLMDDEGPGSVNLPETPSPSQLRALVNVRLPTHGGRIEQVARRGKRVYLERDRHGNPKRILWVDRNGKVFAEMRGDDDDGPERNSIRLGLGDFIFYSVLVSKAAQYSFATFSACMLVILAGLGGTLVLLSVYHHALPALPISIFLGVIFYVVTRLFIEPWIEVVLSRPFYV
jgi:presenilin 1